MKYFNLKLNTGEEIPWVYCYGDSCCCTCTDYALMQGAGTYMWEYSEDSEEYQKYEGNCWWWLRSPGGNSNLAAYVISDGCAAAGGGRVDDTVETIRPALWISNN